MKILVYEASETYCKNQDIAKRNPRILRKFAPDHIDADPELKVNSRSKKEKCQPHCGGTKKGDSKCLRGPLNIGALRKAIGKKETSRRSSIGGNKQSTTRKRRPSLSSALWCITTVNGFTGREPRSWELQQLKPAARGGFQTLASSLEG